MNNGETLTIRNFAGLAHVNVAPARVTAIIGPQASGKSVSAKLLYFFRGLWRELLFYSQGEYTVDARKEWVKQQFRRYFPPETWGEEVFVLQYEVGEHRVQLRRAPSRGKPSEGLILTLPPFCEGLLRQAIELMSGPMVAADASAVHLNRFKVWRKTESELKNYLAGYYYDGQLFIPAGRAFFSNVENNLFSFLSRSERALDPFLAEFGTYFTYTKSSGVRRSRREYATPLAERLLGGRLVIERDREYVHTSDNRDLPLSNLSSGQQEALPLLMMLDPSDDDFRLARGERETTTAAYIEEPEAHLFPDFQKLITERIVDYALAKDGAQSVTITTHSPYVLSTLNNLLLAGRLSVRKSAQKRLAEIVPASRWLRTEDVAAFAFVGGGCKSILDKDVGLIDADYIDSVSNSIATTFDRLLAIEFPSQES